MCWQLDNYPIYLLQISITLCQMENHVQCILHDDLIRAMMYESLILIGIISFVTVFFVCLFYFYFYLTCPSAITVSLCIHFDAIFKTNLILFIATIAHYRLYWCFCWRWNVHHNVVYIFTICLMQNTSCNTTQTNLCKILSKYAKRYMKLT